jgi:hypothetical protein
VLASQVIHNATVSLGIIYNVSVELEPNSRRLFNSLTCIDASNSIAN